MKERPILFSGPMVRALLAGAKTQTRRIVKPQPKYIQDQGLEWYKRDGTFDGWTGEKVSPGYALDAYRCPYGQRGCRLWVRENFMLESNFGIDNEDGYPPPFKDGRPIKWDEAPDWGKWWTQAHYAATDPKPELCKGNNDDRMAGWRPSIHMPRWASRITLEIMDISVQRLLDISEEDAKAEGLSTISKDGGRLWKWGIPDRDGLPGEDDDGWHWQKWQVDPRVAYLSLWNHINGPGSAESNPWVWAITFRKVAP